VGHTPPQSGRQEGTVNRSILRPFAALLLLAIVGCGGSKTDRLREEIIGLQNELAAMMEKGDIQGSEDKIEKIHTRLEEIGQELNSTKLPDQERKKFRQQYEEEYKPIKERLERAYAKLDVEDRKMLDRIFFGGKSRSFIPRMW
jgi:hypothetical protein